MIISIANQAKAELACIPNFSGENLKYQTISIYLMIIKINKKTFIY